MMPACAPVSETAFVPERIDRHGGQRDGGLLAGGEEHIHLALRGVGGHLARELDQPIGDSAHGGDDADDLVARLLRRDDPAGDIEDPLGIADRSAAVFLDDQSHR